MLKFKKVCQLEFYWEYNFCCIQSQPRIFHALDGIHILSLAEATPQFYGECMSNHM